MSLVILTNIPTPYRTAFFDALAGAAADAGQRCHVLYCAKTEPGRHWPYDVDQIKHTHTVLRGFHPHALGITAHINPGVLAELNRLKPDTLIIAGAWNTPTMLVAGLNIFTPNPRRFFWSEGHAAASLHPRGLIAWLRRQIYRTYDGFAVPNAKSAEWAIAQAGGDRPVVTLPNAIDAKFFARPASVDRVTLRQRHGLSEQGRVLVQVGLLASSKGTPELARAFLALPRMIRGDTVLALVGSGPAEAELRALAVSTAGSIRLLGQLPPERVREVLWASDVFVLNTRRDSNPLSVIEAAAAGLPIVMSAAAGNITEVVIQPQTGVVIADPADPTDALIKVLSASDAELAEMGARAAKLARTQFDAPSVARALIAQLYP